MKNFLFKNNFLHFAILTFAFFTFWWLLINPLDSTVFIEAKRGWSSFYWIFAALGGGFGIFTSRKLGLWQSTIGRAVLAFSVGLLLQVLGQVVDSVRLIFTDSYVSYPSISELGYTGSIIAYIYGTFLLAGYVRIRSSLSSLNKTTIVWGVSLFMFALTYLIYLKDYSFTNSNLVSVIFDFGYPVLESVYVALAVFVLVHSSRIGGGVLRKPIIFLVIALILQYISDSYFVYEFNKNNWYSGNLNDFCYLLAYFILTVAIIYFDEILTSLPVVGTDGTQDVNPNILETKYNPSSDYETLARLIIRSQEEIIGPLAWTTVSQVKNIVIRDKENMVLEIMGDPKLVINSLLDNYLNVFGPISINVAKDKTRSIVKYMPTDMVPEKLL